MVEELRNIQREVLPNGLTILTEQMDHIRSVSMGIWVKSGSRHEDPTVNGISHFVEHMVFKGTTNRTRRRHRPPGGLHRRQHGRLHRQRNHLLQHQSSG